MNFSSSYAGLIFGIGHIGIHLVNKKEMES